MPAHQELIDVVAEHIAGEKLAEDFAGEQLAPRRVATGIARVVCWKDVTVELPDDETSVLVFAPDDSEPVWIGFHDDGKWRSPCGMPLAHRVTH